MPWRVSPVVRLAEASRPTVRRGVAELDQPADPRGRIRQHEGPKRRQRTVKALAGAQHPDRDAQLRYLNEQARTQLADAWLEPPADTSTTAGR